MILTTFMILISNWSGFQGSNVPEHYTWQKTQLLLATRGSDEKMQSLLELECAEESWMWCVVFSRLGILERQRLLGQESFCVFSETLVIHCRREDVINCCHWSLSASPASTFTPINSSASANAFLASSLCYLQLLWRRPPSVRPSSGHDISTR